jgi:hypothetical protein
MQRNITEETVHDCAFISYGNAMDQLLGDFDIEIPHTLSQSIFSRNSQWIGWFIHSDGTVEVETE